MTRFLDLINQKWVWILAFLALTIFAHVGLKYYFWSWSAENFDNIVTPIATVISSILFASIAFRQYKQSIIQNEIVNEQNKIILSQNLKSNFQEEIADLEKSISEGNIYNRVFMIAGHRIAQTIPTIITSLSAVDVLVEVIDRLISSQQYHDDLNDMTGGRLGTRTVSYYQSRDYINDLRFIIAFGRHPDLLKIPLVVEFLDRVMASKMLDADMNLFLGKVDRIYTNFYALVLYKTDINVPNILRAGVSPLPWSMLSEMGYNSQMLLLKNKSQRK